MSSRSEENRTSFKRAKSNDRVKEMHQKLNKLNDIINKKNSNQVIPAVCIQANKHHRVDKVSFIASLVLRIL
jgi:predicted transcriptional regulator YdeE